MEKHTEKMVFNEIESNFQLNWKLQACAEFKCITKWKGKSDLIFNFFLPSGKL